MDSIDWVIPDSNWDSDPRTLQRLGAALNCLKGNRILDIGCRDGSFILTAARLAPNKEFVGIDIDKAAIEKAQIAAARLKIENATFYDGDITDVTLSSTLRTVLGEFDTVTIMETLEHLDPGAGQRALDNAISFVKPDGGLLISVPANTHISDPDHRNTFYRENIHRTVKGIQWVKDCPHLWLMWFVDGSDVSGKVQ